MFRKLLLLVTACLFSASLAAAPKAELWERWDRADSSATQTIDHSRWDALLGRYLVAADDGVNRFAYGRVSDADRAQLDAYIDALAQLPILEFRREQQMAYWINLYNAVTVQEILRFYPLDSIRDISSGLFSSGPWKKELVEVDGEALTLDDIEHRILRPIWRDPRIHYAVNCASIGCPNLQPQAFTAGNTEMLLERGARDFVNHPRGARVVDGDLEVSSIYEWFKEDFDNSDAGVITHLRQYADAELLAALDGIERIDDDDYDWSINDTK